MPTVSIYVPNEDYDKFRAIEKKSEFIHNALNRGVVNDNTGVPTSRRKPIKTKEDAREAVQKIFPDAKPITYKKTGNWGA